MSSRSSSPPSWSWIPACAGMTGEGVRSGLASEPEQALEEILLAGAARLRGRRGPAVVAGVGVARGSARIGHRRVGADAARQAHGLLVLEGDLHEVVPGLHRQV